MFFGGDFFKIFNLVVQIMRLFAKVFGDDEAKQEALESEKRSAENNGDAC